MLDKQAGLITAGGQTKLHRLHTRTCLGLDNTGYATCTRATLPPRLLRRSRQQHLPRHSYPPVSASWPGPMQLVSPQLDDRALLSVGGLRNESVGVSL